MPPRGRKNGSDPIRLDAVASISRTSGQNQDGDAYVRLRGIEDQVWRLLMLCRLVLHRLRNLEFQERYAATLSTKVCKLEVI